MGKACSRATSPCEGIQRLLGRFTDVMGPEMAMCMGQGSFRGMSAAITMLQEVAMKHDMQSREDGDMLMPEHQMNQGAQTVQYTRPEAIR